MAEWLVEDGIAEIRAVRLDAGQITAARVEWPGEITAGQVSEAKLVSRNAGSSRGTARLTDGTEVLVDRLPAALSQGATVTVEITRPPLGESARMKRAHGRVTERPAGALTLVEQLRSAGHSVRQVASFPGNDWDALVCDALSSTVEFAGGSLHFSPTPAMLLIDVDGTLDPRALALAAVVPLANSLQRFDVGGSIGVDFPTLTAKSDRREVDEALDHALAEWPHERTAMNGFGFVQLVARLERPSLLHRAQFQRAAMAIRLLLRRAERLSGAGAIELRGHPALEAELSADMRGELSRRTGREVRWRTDPGLALEAPHAQLVAR